MGTRSRCFPVGIRTRVFSWTARESLLALVSAWDCLAASAGDGTTGDTIGTTTGESSTTTTRTSRIAGLSLIATVFARVERTSIMAPIHVTAILAGVRRLTGRPTRTERQERIPAPLAGSAMEEVREPTLTEDGPALADSTEEAASTVAEAGTAAEATDSLHEEIKPLNDK